MFMGRLHILGDVVDTLGVPVGGGRLRISRIPRGCVYHMCKEPTARFTESNIVSLRIVRDTGNVHYLLVIESSV